jgi:Cu+-exporting ATPase
MPDTAKKENETESAASPSEASHQQTSLEITGMTCASCVRRVEKALSKVPGVASANVNLATERATVSFDPSTTEITALVAAVERPVTEQ